MAKLTHGVEIEIEKHMENLELQVQKTGAVLENLEPELDRLRDKLAKVDDFISQSLDSTLKRSVETINIGLNDAVNLERILAVLMQTVLDGTSHVAAAQEKSMNVFGKGSNDLDKWAAAVATATASALSLNDHIVSDHDQSVSTT